MADASGATSVHHPHSLHSWFEAQHIAPQECCAGSGKQLAIAFAGLTQTAGVAVTTGAVACACHEDVYVLVRNRRFVSVKVVV